MTERSLKKFFSFIIAIMMFSVLPQLANAQKNKPCPPGYRLVCYRDPWSGTRVCRCEHNGNGKIISDNETSQQSITNNYELEHPLITSIKIYDATGRLVRTILDGKKQESNHQIEWDGKDENGKAVATGIYALHIVSSGKSETKKFSII